MNRINLLPHRQERRDAARKHFFIVAAMTAVLGGAVALLVHGYNAAQVSEQVSRNDFLKKETEKLDVEIAEIKKLKDEIQALLARKQVIETLQADRAQTVYLLDQLVQQMPEGVYLRSISQKGGARQSGRLRTIQRPCVDADAQRRGFAVARSAKAQRDQGRGCRRQARVRIQSGCFAQARPEHHGR